MFIDPHAYDPLPKVWDEDSRVGDMLKGKRGVVVGVANADSIAFGCAAKLQAFGAGIAHFDEVIDMAVTRAPGRRLVDIGEVGRTVAFLVSGGASGMTGDVIYVDAGAHIMA